MSSAKAWAFKKNIANGKAMCSTEKHQVTFILSSEVLLQEPTEAELSDSASGHHAVKKPERTKKT